MGTVVDEIERNAFIEYAKTYLEFGGSAEIILKSLCKKLEISIEEATRIYETENLGTLAV